MGKLDGRVAVVTGAARGIGAAAAEALAKEGAKVCVNIRSESRREEANGVVEKIKAQGGEAFVYQADVTQPEEVCAMFKEVADRYGGIDILVNNAGTLVRGRLQDTSYEDIDKRLRADLFSVCVCMKEAYPYLVKSKHGRVINVTSQLGQKGEGEVAIYCAAKTGVIGLTRAMALEYSALGEGNNILVNAVAPGPIEGGLSADMSPELRELKEATLPLGRLGTPEECASSFVFLAGDECTLFYGQTLGATCGDTMV